MILKCTCKHKYQDTKYGPGMRVHTYGESSIRGKGWRCTVCRSTKASAKKEA